MAEFVINTKGFPSIPSHFQPFPVISRRFQLCWAGCDGVSQNGADHMVRTKQGNQGWERTWCAGVSQNGADHMVRTKQGTQGWWGQNRELMDRNGLGVLGSVGMQLAMWWEHSILPHITQSPKLWEATMGSCGVKTNLNIKKSRIRETSNLSTDADCRTDTILESLRDLSRKKRKKMGRLTCPRVHATAPRGGDGRSAPTPRF